MATHLEQSNYLANHQPGVRLCLDFAVPFTNLNKLYKGQNHFAEPNQHVLTFLHPIFSLRGCILSTSGVALKNHPPVAEEIVMMMMMMKMWERQQTMIICEREDDREEKGKLG
jgi:hypothetical protein